MKLIVIFSTFLVKRQWALLEMALYIYCIIDYKSRAQLANVGMRMTQLGAAP